MKRILLIGYGAIGMTIKLSLEGFLSARVSHLLVRPERATYARDVIGEDIELVTDLPAFLKSPHQVDVVADCAGHTALASDGTSILEAGVDLCSLSCGALADSALKKNCKTLQPLAVRSSP